MLNINNGVTVKELKGKGLKIVQLNGTWFYDGVISGDNLWILYEKGYIRKLVDRFMYDFNKTYSILPMVEILDNIEERIFDKLQPKDFEVRVYGNFGTEKPADDYVLKSHEFSWQINDVLTPIKRVWDRILEDIERKEISKDEMYKKLGDLGFVDIYYGFGGITWIFENSLLDGTMFKGVRGISGGYEVNGKDCFGVNTFNGNFAIIRGGSAEVIVFSIEPSKSGIRTDKPDCYVGVYSVYNQNKRTYKYCKLN